MTEVVWKPTLLLPQDPDATLDYTLDFTPYLEGDTIDSVTVTGQGCTVEKRTSDATTVTVRVSAVVDRASVTASITRASGQRDDRTIKLIAQPH